MLMNYEINVKSIGSTHYKMFEALKMKMGNSGYQSFKSSAGISNKSVIEYALKAAMEHYDLKIEADDDDLEFLDLANNPGQALFLKDWKEKNLNGNNKKSI